MNGIDTNLVVAIASVVTATSVLILLYQSWISAKNLQEFQKVSLFEKEQSQKVEAIKLLDNWDEYQSQSMPRNFSIYLVTCHIEQVDIPKLISGEQVVISSSFKDEVEGIFRDNSDFLAFDPDRTSAEVNILNDQIILNGKQSELITRYCKGYLLNLDKLLKAWKYEVAHRGMIEDHLLGTMKNVKGERQVHAEKMLLEFEKMWSPSFSYPEVREFINHMDSKITYQGSQSS